MTAAPTDEFHAWAVAALREVARQLDLPPELLDEEPPPMTDAPADPDPLLETCTVQTASGPLVVERRRDSWRILRPVDGSPVDEEVGRYRDAWGLAVHLAMAWSRESQEHEAAVAWSAWACHQEWCRRCGEGSDCAGGQALRAAAHAFDTPETRPPT